MGDTLPTRVPEDEVAVVLSERQLRKTERTPEGHLLWTGALANGHPAAKYEGETVYLKRLIWETLKGPIPEDLVVTSRCRLLTCISPSHLVLTNRGRHAGYRNG